MKKIFFLVLYLISIIGYGQENRLSIFQNVREGSPVYKEFIKTEENININENSVSNDFENKLTKDRLPQEMIIEAFNSVLTSDKKKNKCSFWIIENFQSKLNDKNLNYSKYKDIIIEVLRDNDQIDDIVFNILLKSDVSKGKFLTPLWTNLRLTDDAKLNILNNFKQFEKRQSKRKCLSDNWRTLVSSFIKENIEISNFTLKKLNYLAYSTNTVSKESYNLLERARKNKIHEWRLTLLDYHKKVNFLRRQYPLSKIDKSDFVTQKVKKKNLSIRQRLFEKYSTYQIIVMAQVINSFSKRIGATSAEISINYDEDKSEVISLNSMDRYRLYTALLRKEMNELTTNSIFNGKRPNYKELITAAYELDLVSASEVDHVVLIEQLWNPQKTRLQKAMVWIKTFGVAASVVIPSPYGILATLGLMAIEISTEKDNDPLEHSIFY